MLNLYVYHFEESLNMVKIIIWYPHLLWEFHKFSKYFSLIIQ